MNAFFSSERERVIKKTMCFLGDKRKQERKENEGKFLLSCWNKFHSRIKTHAILELSDTYKRMKFSSTLKKCWQFRIKRDDWKLWNINLIFKMSDNPCLNLNIIWESADIIVDSRFSYWWWRLRYLKSQCNFFFLGKECFFKADVYDGKFCWNFAGGEKILFSSPTNKMNKSEINPQLLNVQVLKEKRQENDWCLEEPRSIEIENCSHIFFLLWVLHVDN